MAAVSRQDLAAFREGTVAGTPAEIANSSLHSSSNDSRSTVTGTGTERVHSASPYSTGEQV